MAGSWPQRRAAGDGGGLQQLLCVIFVLIQVEVDLLGIRAKAPAGQPALGPGGNGLDQGGDLLGRGSRHPKEAQGVGSGVMQVGSVQNQAMGVKVEVERSAKALHGAHRAAMELSVGSKGMVLSGRIPVRGKDGLQADAQHAAGQIVPPGQQQAAGPGHGQHPLPQARLRQAVAE